jgi:hypothetical protein
MDRDAMSLSWCVVVVSPIRAAQASDHFEPGDVISSGTGILTMRSRYFYYLFGEMGDLDVNLEERS